MALLRASAWVAPLLLLCVQSMVEGVRYYPSYDYIRSDVEGCRSYTCGVNAHCIEAAGRPVCACLPGHAGDPLHQCTRAECLDHEECRGHLACHNNRCINPCDGVCGVNAQCDVRKHVAVCSCPHGYTGDPFSGCRILDPEEQCHPSPCGENTKCDVINNVPTCSCLPGFRGNALTGCRHECESDNECGYQRVCSNFKCTNPCEACGLNAECDVRNHIAICKCPPGYIGSPTSSCRPECEANSDCPYNKPACSYNKCINPCEGVCGFQADCNLRGSTPVCSCPRNMTGNPFVSCRPFEARDLCEPNPCGANAQCIPGHDVTGKERPVCNCLPGYVGNSLISCQRGECQTDAECGDHRACERYSCVNPCIGQCGTGAECNARRHIAVCTCPTGTHGDALVNCYEKESYAAGRYGSSRYLRYRYRRGHESEFTDPAQDESPVIEDAYEEEKAAEELLKPK